MKLHNSFFTIATLLLPGCLSMSKQEKTRDLYANVDLHPNLMQGLQSSFFIEGTWPNPHWWEEFHQEELSTLVNYALENSPTLHVAQQRLLAAKEQSQIVRASRFPSLFFQAEDNWQYLSQNGFTHLLNPSLPLNGYEVDLSLAFQYEFDFFGKNKNRLLAALGQAKAEEAELAETALILTSALTQSYFAYLIDHAKKELYEQLCHIQQERLSIQAKLQEQALSSHLPLLLDEEKYQATKQNLLGIQEEIEVQQHQINLLAGRSPDAPVTLGSLASTLPPFPLPVDLSLNLLSRRPDLLAQLWRVEALAHEVSAAKADFFPDINLAALAGLGSVHFASLFQSSSKRAGLTPALQLPLFTAGSIRANIRQKHALFTSAVWEYNQMLLHSAREIGDLLSHMRSVFAQKDLQQDIVAKAKQRYDLIQHRQQGGLENTLTLLSYQEELLHQSLQELSLLYYQYALTCKLIQALGGGFIANSSPLEGGS
ncbi:MAG: efflux transporter outer membrane subunit [Chlamydiae bacterium]|nr:efflux transporter outer membrane subunit [Chlamydiota bacterium]